MMVGRDLFFHDYERYGYSEEDFEDNVVADAEWEEVVEPKELPVLEKEEDQMLAVIVILVGVALEIVKVNAWFIVPDMAIYIVFGIGVVLAIISIISGIVARKRFNGMSKRVNSFMRR